MGLHEVDPERKSDEAVTLAEEQIEGAREHFKLLGSRPFIPFLTTQRMDGLSDDAHKMGWWAYPTEMDRSLWLEKYGDTLDLISSFVQDPDQSEAYEERMLEIATRYYELTNPGPTIIMVTEDGAVDVSSTILNGISRVL